MILVIKRLPLAQSPLFQSCGDLQHFCDRECEKDIPVNCDAAAQVHQSPQEMIALFGIDTSTSTQQVCYKSLQKRPRLCNHTFSQAA